MPIAHTRTDLELPPWPGLHSGHFMVKALHLPFDLMRNQHAQAIRSGLMANSILESREFEKRVDTLERLCLGPFARRV